MTEHLEDLDFADEIALSSSDHANVQVKTDRLEMLSWTSDANCGEGLKCFIDLPKSCFREYFFSLFLHL